MSGSSVVSGPRMRPMPRVCVGGMAMARAAQWHPWRALRRAKQALPRPEGKQAPSLELGTVCLVLRGGAQCGAAS